MGLFVTFEGSEGSGKSTNIGLLEEFLRSRGVRVLALREPGGTAVGEEVRRLVKRVDIFPPPCAEAELLLFLASRAQLTRERILPALADGMTVLCDRYYDSTIAYQGGARAIPLEIVRAINSFAIGGCRPNLTFLLDLPAADGLRRSRRRIGEGPDRLEREALPFFERVRKIYLQIAAEEPKRFCVLDAGQSISAVQKKIRQTLVDRGNLW
jgi:dTMP kinase